VRRMTRIIVIKCAALAATIALLVGTAALVYYRSPRRGLPYHDQFAKGKLGEWQQFGGTWSVVDGALHEDTDDRGVKLITGSQYWTNYNVQVDLQLLGGGDAGIVIRANDVEEGVDSYSGYYAGLRINDQSLVLGRADYGWLEFPPVHMPGGVAPNRWYHLTLAAVGCTIQASATALDTGESTSTSAYDPNCPRSGKIGIRAVASGGIWRNLKVQRLDSVDLPGKAPQRPTPLTFYPTDQGLYPRSNGIEGYTGLLGSPDGSPADVVPLSSLRLLAVSRPVHAKVRGTITITSPGVYIQDATAGAQVVFAHTTSLRRGDEVEITGDAHLEDLSLRIENATARSIAGVVPVPAMSITPLQAAMGRYDSMFVEMEGRLDSNLRTGGSVIRLQLSGGQQQYYAISNSRETAMRFERLKQGSTLRMRGICLVGAAYTENKLPFALIVLSPDDVEVISGPPWWTAEHLALMAVGMLALGFVFHVLYSHADQQRRTAVLEERERLAHEMHDTLAQSFAGLDFKLRAIRNRTRHESQSIDAVKLREEVQEACELVRHSHDEARRSLVSLRPEVLEKHGLSDALTQVANRMVAGSSMDCNVEITGQPRHLPVRIADAFFRIGQEAIANTLQHSHAKNLSLKLDYQRSQLTMVIEDDGQGFRSDQQAEGFGLTGMRRRAESVNARIQIESNGRGTRITVLVPCKAESFWLFSLSYIKSNGRK
jgi:signal transduction histidine kinase